MNSEISVRAILTIDDAPSSSTQIILDALKQNHVTAIFFCLGANMAQFPEMSQEIVRAGHTIGNHAYSHKAFSQMSLEEGIAEIELTERLIEDVHSQAGIPRKVKVFRFPYGDKGFGRNSQYALLERYSPKVRALQQHLLRLKFQSPRSLGIQMPNIPSTESPLYWDQDWLWSGDSWDWLFTMNALNPLEFGNWIDQKIIPSATDSQCEVLLFHDHFGHGHLLQQILPALTARFHFTPNERI
jgi:peptidoglycan/xylan/chitin deacetylase (PgdA/CDA1 family)